MSEEEGQTEKKKSKLKWRKLEFHIKTDNKT
jgi:hypothetical protein